MNCDGVDRGKEDKAEVTFVLPTLNRWPWVKRALDSCLACENEVIRPHVVVIDSKSGDGTFAFLQEAYGADPRVTLKQNSRSAGCIPSWFDGVDLVRTDFATFVWDDDVLSLYFGDMAAQMVREGAEFVMGFGGLSDIDRLYPFEPIKEYRTYAASDVLLGYFGFHGPLNLPSLPVSPICCLLTADLLRAWVKEVKAFVSQNSLRRHFMFDVGFGPDLMVYLLALLQENHRVIVAPSVVAQFSSHPESLTIKSRAFVTAVGYWLAKEWAFEKLAEAGRRDDAAKSAAYVLLRGARYVLMQIASLRVEWVGSILRECWQIVARLFKMGIARPVLRSTLELLITRVRSPQHR